MTKYTTIIELTTIVNVLLKHSTIQEAHTAN